MANNDIDYLKWLLDCIEVMQNSGSYHLYLK